MGKFCLRKTIREILISEYGDYSMFRTDAYPTGTPQFPNFDKDHPLTPSDIDFWNDLEFEDDNDKPFFGDVETEQENVLDSKKNN
jgi:hypothetical protein